MGNYNGTTRCSVCYESGHNKAGCPTAKKRVERLREQDPNNWQVQRADAAAKARTKRATGKRKCAYCKTHRKSWDRWDWDNMDDAERAALNAVEVSDNDGYSTRHIETDTLYGTGGERGVGHSIRACKYKKNDVEVAAVETATIRRDFLNRMKAEGLGIGAAVSFPEGSRNADKWAPGSMVVQRIQWQGISSMNNMTHAEVLHLVDVRYIMTHNAPYGSALSAALPRTVTLAEDEPSQWQDVVDTVVHGANPEKIESSIPEGWLTGRDEATTRAINENLMRDVKTRAKS